MAKDFKSQERATAKILGDWWGVPFRRTPSSGAWNTQSRNMGHGTTDFYGDIVAPPEANFPFSIECKAYKEVELYKALYAKSNIFAWWEQARGDAKAVGKQPFLVMKENRKQPLMAISQYAYVRLSKAGAIHLPVVYMHLCWMLESGVHRNVYVMDLKAFVESVPVKLVKKVFNGK